MIFSGLCVLNALSADRKAVWAGLSLFRLRPSRACLRLSRWQQRVIWCVSWQVGQTV